MPPHARAHHDIDGGGGGAGDRFGSPGLGQTIGADAHQPVPHQLGGPGALGAGDVERAEIGGRRHRIDDHVALRGQRLEVGPGPEVADADAGLHLHRGFVPDGFVEGHQVLGVHHEAVGLLGVDVALGLTDQRLALGEIEFLALRLGELVVFRAVEAHEIIAVGDVG